MPPASLHERRIPETSSQCPAFQNALQSTRILNFAYNSLVAMLRSSILDLEQLVLRFPRAKLRGTAGTQVTLSRPELDESFPDLENDVATFERAWIRRGGRLALVIRVTLDGQVVGPEMNAQIQSMLLDAKVGKIPTITKGRVEHHAETLAIDMEAAWASSFTRPERKSKRRRRECQCGSALLRYR